MKFLVSKKKEGQFRALWGDFGELVNLMASGEMVVCDAWQPAVMAVKAQGKPAKYAIPKEGYRAWSIGPSLIAGSPNKEAVYAYADYWLSGPPGITVSEQGYYSPSTNIKNVMPADKYAFWYDGKPWKGAVVSNTSFFIDLAPRSSGFIGLPISAQLNTTEARRQATYGRIVQQWATLPRRSGGTA